MSSFGIQKKYFSVLEVAKYLGVSKFTIYRLTREQMIPFYSVRDRLVFDLADVDAWMNAQKVPARPESFKMVANGNL